MQMEDVPSPEPAQTDAKAASMKKARRSGPFPCCSKRYRGIRTPSRPCRPCRRRPASPARPSSAARSEEHTSELQSLIRISYAVFCLKEKTTTTTAQRVYNPPHATSNNTHKHY